MNIEKVNEDIETSDLETKQAGEEVQNPSNPDESKVILDQEDPSDVQTSQNEQDEESLESPLKVSFGDEEDEDTSGNSVIRQIRKANKNLANKLKKQAEELDALRKQVPQSRKEDSLTLGPRPTLESCDYDSDAYIEKLDSWYEEKVKFDEQVRVKKAKEAEEAAKFYEKVQTFKQKQAELNAPDIEEVEAVVTSTLTPFQMQALVEAAENPALTMYALGKNQKKLKEMADYKDPVKFIYNLAKLEAKLKVEDMRNKPKVKPEATLPGGASVSPVSGSEKLEILRNEARRTGDYTDFNNYKRSLNK